MRESAPCSGSLCGALPDGTERCARALSVSLPATAGYGFGFRLQNYKKFGYWHAICRKCGTLATLGMAIFIWRPFLCDKVAVGRLKDSAPVHTHTQSGAELSAASCEPNHRKLRTHPQEAVSPFTGNG